jgi:hypothetical protein
MGVCPCAPGVTNSAGPAMPAQANRPARETISGLLLAGWCAFSILDLGSISQAKREIIALPLVSYALSAISDSPGT